MSDEPQIVDTVAQIVDSAALVHQPIGQVSIYASTDPKAQLDEARARAAVLVDVVKEQGLARSFGGGKAHVQVEGWQFLGSQFGLIADIEWTRELDDGWEARAAIRRLADGMVISHAEAECRRTESNWKNSDSYAIRSMAQTRATSKVFRNALSSVMVMAGFAGTPAEEMVEDTPITEADPHCPGCRVNNGELVPVYHNEKAPFWKCKKKPSECGGASKDKKGKLWQWSGWEESWEDAASVWLSENGQGATTQLSEISAGSWMQNAVQALNGWDEETRHQMYRQVANELGFRNDDGSVDLDMERAKAIFEGMHKAWSIEQEAPF